jgi:hypothetical protein
MAAMVGGGPVGTGAADPPIPCVQENATASYGLVEPERGGAASMTETTDAVISEALSVIDKALAQMMRRELVSSGEITDVLLDVRSLLTMPATQAAADPAEPTPV